MEAKAQKEKDATAMGYIRAGLGMIKSATPKPGQAAPKVSKSRRAAAASARTVKKGSTRKAK